MFHERKLSIDMSEQFPHYCHSFMFSRDMSKALKGGMVTQVRDHDGYVLFISMATPCLLFIAMFLNDGKIRKGKCGWSDGDPIIVMVERALYIQSL